MRTIVAIAQQDVWERSLKDGEYTESTIDSTLAEVGFIHCSFPEQTIDTANRHFADRKLGPLVLLLIDAEKVTSSIKYERALSGRKGTFPHIYGPLNVDAVYGAITLVKGESNKFITPRGLIELIQGGIR